MRAMLFDGPGKPLRMADVPIPEPGPGQVQVRVHACGVCRTDLHVVDGELPDPKLPLVLGHQVVGHVTALGEGVSGFSPGDRVGIPWLGWTCGECRYCRSGRENLCDRAKFTGYHLDGGFAEFTVVDHRYAFPIPGDYPDLQAAPLLCAGLIGYRSYRFTGDAETIGFYGFGAAAHIICQVARYEGKRVFAFVRPGDERGAAFAREMGAEWAGGSDEPSPEPLDAAILFAPVGALLPKALRDVRKGGRVVCGGIYMSDIPSFPYEILWEEREVVSVANLTRQDGIEFLALAPKVPVRTKPVPYPLEKAGQALDDLRAGRFDGAAVVVVNEDLLVG